MIDGLHIGSNMAFHLFQSHLCTTNTLLSCNGDLFHHTVNKQPRAITTLVSTAGSTSVRNRPERNSDAPATSFRTSFMRHSQIQGMSSIKYSIRLHGVTA